MAKKEETATMIAPILETRLTALSERIATLESLCDRLQSRINELSLNSGRAVARVETPG